MKNHIEQEDKIMAFIVDGRPLTNKEMLKVLTKAISDVENGKGLSSSNIRKAKKSW